MNSNPSMTMQGQPGSAITSSSFQKHLGATKIFFTLKNSLKMRKIEVMEKLRSNFENVENEINLVQKQ